MISPCPTTGGGRCWWWPWPSDDSGGTAVAAFLWTIVVAAVVQLYRSRAYGKWARLNVPHARPAYPLFGNTFGLSAGLEHPVETYDRIYRRFEGEKYCGLYRMSTAYLMVRDPALVHRIAVRDFTHFADRGFDGAETDPAVNPMAGSLLFCTGRKWRTMRRKLQPAFATDKIAAMRARVAECADRLVGRLDADVVGLERRGAAVPVPVKRMVGAYSTDVIGTCVFGLQLDAIGDERSEFRAHAKKIFHQSRAERVAVRVLQTVSVRLVRALRLRLYPWDSTEFFCAAFKRVIDRRRDDRVVGDDVTQILAEARDELVREIRAGADADDDTNDTYTESDIIGNAILFFVSGSGTVTSTVALCFYELALNKHVQDKLREEIKVKLEKCGGQFDYDFITGLHYAKMVLNETARMYSITCTLLREATKEYNVPGESLVIEKGQKIIIPMYNIHNDPKYYPNPRVFDPERFSPEQSSKRMNGTFIPFGDGPRMCIGKRLAELEMIMILSKVLSKYEVLPCEKTEIPLDIRNGSGFVSPKNEVWLSFKSIADQTTTV